MNKTNKTKALEKKDRVYIGFVALYYIYCLIRNIMNPFSYSNIDINITNPLLLTDIIVTVFVIGFICYLNSKYNLQSSFWGLVINKNVWYVFGFIVLAIIYFIIYYKPNSPINLYYALFITLNIIGYELVFRASLIKFIISYLGKSNKNIFTAIIISSLIYSLVLYPIDNHSYITFATILIFGFLYYLSRNILLFVFLLAGYIVPNEYGLYIGIITLLLYFIITLTVKLLFRSQKNQQQISHDYT